MTHTTAGRVVITVCIKTKMKVEKTKIEEKRILGQLSLGARGIIGKETKANVEKQVELSKDPVKFS